MRRTGGRRTLDAGQHRHKLAGHEPPTSQEGVRAVLRGIRRTIGAARAGKAPATADILTAMLRLCPATLAGARDQALLALGFAGAFRRSELVALEVADLTEAPDGLRVRIRRSKTDQESEGAEMPFRAATACAPSKRCKPGWPRRSATVRCSARC